MNESHVIIVSQNDGLIDGIVSPKSNVLYWSYHLFKLQEKTKLNEIHHFYFNDS